MLTLEKSRKCLKTFYQQRFYQQRFFGEEIKVATAQGMIPTTLVRGMSRAVLQTLLGILSVLHPLKRKKKRK